MMGRPKPTSRRSASAPDTGLRRVSWVRIVLDGDGAHCDVLGVGHRLPATRPVSLDTALALKSAGVPTIVRSADGNERLLRAG
jgi:hypothetical protein